MEIPDYQPFYLSDLDDLRREAARIGLDLPISEDLTLLKESVSVGGKTAPNRFCAQPITGNDAEDDGGPGSLTIRRYSRSAAGGFGLIWVESVLPGSEAAPGQLSLASEKAGVFRDWVASIRKAAEKNWEWDPLIVLQLDSPLPEDDSGIVRIADRTVETAVLAKAAGFDGIDLKATTGSLAGELLAARDRAGPFGAFFENRSRFLRETFASIREKEPELLLAMRLTAYNGMEGDAGFGVDSFDSRRPDLEEPIQLAQQLREAGCLDLLNVTCASLNLRAPSPERHRASRADWENPDEHPLQVLNRQLELAGTMRATLTGVPVVGSGFSWLRQFVPAVATGAIANGWIDFVGLGRGALACPDLPGSVFKSRPLEPERTCMVCFACSTLAEDAQPVGCVIRDPGIYGPFFQKGRHFAPDRLMAEARRCHFCEAAPCVQACPTDTDIPGFIRAYLDGNLERAYEIIRERDPLPETTSRLSPGWLESEGACIEAALTGRPVPILDLQYAISWEARSRGGIGVRMPADSTGRKVAVVGGGPAGLAAAIRLLERGHAVAVFEESSVLGGTPHRIIPGDRLPDITPEINDILAPADEGGRLQIRRGTSLGKDITLNQLLEEYDAVLVTAGLWRERSLESGGEIDGVTGGLQFLEETKQGLQTTIPPRVAVLAGGDSAMDAADMVRKLGAEQLFVVFGGPRSELHWHRSDGWFALAGVHAFMFCEPLGYERSDNGVVHGVRIRHREFGQESILRVDMVIESMGLEPREDIVAALGGEIPTFAGFRTRRERVYVAGGLINGGASVVRCVAEGQSAAESIHSDLFP